MHISGHIIDEAIRTILGTRDMCGNERDAVKQIADDHGIKDDADILKLFRIASFRANAKWRTSQIKAGVKPKYIW